MESLDPKAISVSVPVVSDGTPSATNSDGGPVITATNDVPTQSTTDHTTNVTASSQIDLNSTEAPMAPSSNPSLASNTSTSTVSTSSKIPSVTQSQERQQQEDDKQKAAMVPSLRQETGGNERQIETPSTPLPLSSEEPSTGTDIRGAPRLTLSTDTVLKDHPPSIITTDVTALTSANPQTSTSTSGIPQTSTPTTTTIPQTPQTYLTFLLISGHRRTMSFEPETTLGRVKELVWGGWPVDWPAEERPPAPSYIRILFLGRMLQDDDTLLNLKLPTHPPSASGPGPIPITPIDAPTPTVEGPTEGGHRPDKPPPTTIMHISVRPFGGVGDEAAGSVKKGKGRRRTREGGEPEDVGGEEARAGCCGCVIC